jgi:hypothetical protein
MNDSFEDRLGRSLTEIVPEPPTADLAGAARTYARRARRRGQGIVAGAAAVAVLAAIGVPWAVTRGGESGSDRGGEPVKKPEVAALECPDKVDRGRLPGKRDEPLKKGAVRAVICPARGSGLFQPPQDALESGLDEFVASVNARPPMKSTACPLNLGTAWTVLLEYADGTAASVTGENYGCGPLFLGPNGSSGQARDGADAVYRKYLGLLAAQRANRQRPATEVPLSCPSSKAPFSPVRQDPKALGLTHAMLCWRTETLTRTPFQSAPLDDELIALINADIAERSTGRRHDGGAECNERLRVEIVAQNGWGDRMLISGSGCGLFGTGEWFWQPGEEVQQRLEELIESQPPPKVPLPTAADHPDAVVRAWADLVNLGDRAKADRLWAVDPTLPTAGVAKIGFKDSGMRRVAPESGTPAAAYAQVWLMEDALYWEGADESSFRNVDITIVRDSDAEPWRILSIVDRGQASVGR